MAPHSSLPVKPSAYPDAWRRWPTLADWGMPLIREGWMSTTRTIGTRWPRLSVMEREHSFLCCFFSISSLLITTLVNTLRSLLHNTN